ncbi:MAG TPA: YceI family protein [Nitrolancea sp.]|nr:YceI family protein [Nitrolancea sp.]
MSATETTVATWNIDAIHSTAEFAVRHMMVATAKGRFGSLEGSIKVNESDPSASSVTATIDVGTIDTNDPNRDTHLRSDDFFNAEQFPTITFQSKRVDVEDANNWHVVGDLTIRDVTREVVLDTEYLGQVQDFQGQQRAGFTAETRLSRKEFGLKWNAALESGGVAVGDQVRVTLHIEAIRQD